MSPVTASQDPVVTPDPTSAPLATATRSGTSSSPSANPANPSPSNIKPAPSPSKRATQPTVASSIKKVTNCKIIYSNQKERFDEPKIDITRIKKEFKFKPTNNFDNFIPDIIKKYKL